MEKKKIKQKLLSLSTAIAVMLNLPFAMDFTVKAADHTDHKVCVNCAEKSHTCTHNNETWLEWTSDNSLPTSGNYYLTQNVKVTDETVIVENTELSLCLNGCTVTMDSSAVGKSIYQVEGTLNLSDCKTTGKITGVSYDVASNPKNYAPIYLGDVGKFNMYGGTITGNSAEKAGGVYVNRNSVFNMYGGIISNNTAKSDIQRNNYLGTGGGVYIYAGTFTMYGGTISDNTAESGGGVYNASGKFIMKGGTISGNNALEGAGVYNDEVFTMEAGSISGNTSTSYGGGVFNNFDIGAALSGDPITFKMAGGMISGNKALLGGGVYNKGKIVLGKKVSITSNTLTDSTTASNVNLATYYDYQKGGYVNSVITIESDFDAENSEVGVTTVTAPTSCADSVTISGTTANNVSAGFTSDNAACHIIYDAKVLKLSGSHPTSLTKVAEIPATETKTGVKAHWHCSACNKDFLDENGTIEATDLTIPMLTHTHTLGEVEGKPATATETGIRKHWKCSACGKLFSDENGTTEISESDTIIQPTGTQPTDPPVSSSSSESSSTDPTPAESSSATPINPTPTTTTTSEPTPTETAATTEPNHSNPDFFPNIDLGSIVKEVEQKEDVPTADLATPVKDLLQAIMSTEELAAIKDTDNIKIILKVENASETVPTEDKQQVEAVLQENSDYNLGQYLDVTLLKVVNGSETKITNTTAPITVTFEVPEAFKKANRAFSVIRVHEDERTVLNDLDDDPDTVTIETDKFSTYALVYTDKEGNPNTGVYVSIIPLAIAASSLGALVIRKNKNSSK